MKTKKKTFITLEEALKNGNSTVNQNIKSKFIQQHVMANVNSMVEYILQTAQDVGSDSNPPFNLDDIENYYSYPEYRGDHAAFDGGSEEDRDAEIERLDDLFEVSGTDVDLLQAEINDLENLDTEPQEVFEWWIVSSFLCEKLKALGHPVISFENIWGRCTTGQAILLDYAITQICADMGILEGQENSWA